MAKIVIEVDISEDDLDKGLLHSVVDSALITMEENELESIVFHDLHGRTVRVTQAG